MENSLCVGDNEFVQCVDLNALYIKNPVATFFMRVAGSSMTSEGIFDGDTLIVDRSIEADEGDVVVANFRGGFVVKKLVLKPVVKLMSCSEQEYESFTIRDSDDFSVFGVVTSVAHSLRQSAP